MGIKFKCMNKICYIFLELLKDNVNLKINQLQDPFRMFSRQYFCWSGKLIIMSANGSKRHIVAAIKPIIQYTR